MLNVAPRLIKAVCPEGSGTGRLHGTVLFADIKGFSKLTETLKKEGSAGADRLSRVINSIYRPALDRVFDMDGSVLSFIGDSFIAAFPRTSDDRLPNLCSYLKEDIPRRILRASGISAGVRTGMSEGSMEWGVIDVDGLASWYMRGSAVENACRAAYDVEGNSGNDSGVSNPADSVPAGLSGIRMGSSFSRRFFPREIVSMKFSGEFRTTAPVFLSFDGDVPENQLRNIVKRVMKLAVVFGGYFAGIFFDEKGGSILVPFGVPRSRERAMERALSFSTSVMEALSEYVSIGIAYGRVYAGFIGSRRRNSYTVIGDEVNNAARLSFIGEKGDILTTSDLESRLRDLTLGHRYFGTLKLKGREVPVRCFAVDRGSQQDLRSSGNLVGRLDELEILRDFAFGSFDSRIMGSILVQGSPGIGKSCLTARLAESVSGDCRILRTEAFEMDYSSIAPLERIIGRILGVSLHSEDPEALESAWTRLMEGSSRSDDRLGHDLTRRMILWLAGKGPPPEGGTEPSRVAREMEIVLRTWCGSTPLLLIAEDAQWMSSEVLQVLDHLGNGKGISVVMTSRKILDDLGIRFHRTVRLDPLTKDEILDILEQRTETVPDGRLVDLIMEKSGGNPFTAVQFFDLLAESGEGGTVLVDEDLNAAINEIPDEIAEILTARIDRMEPRLRRGILSISVLGNCFTLPVFNRILGDHYETVLRDGIQAEIWEPVGDDEFIFKHALLQQAASSIPLGKDLMRLHYRAFRALDEVYPDDTSTASLKALQLERAGRPSRAAVFYKAAGDYFKMRYLNSESLDSYRSMERCLPESDVDGRLLARGNLCTRLECLGEWEEAIGIYVDSITLAQDSGQRLHEGRLMLSLGKLQLMRGMLEKGKATLDGALCIFKELDDKDMISRVHSNLALYYYHCGNYDSAEEYAEMFLQSSIDLGIRIHEAMAYGFLTVIAQNKDELERALSISRRQLELAQELGNAECQVDAYTNMGFIFGMMGNLNSAYDNYMKSMEVVEKSGLYAERMATLGLLASLELKRGNSREASIKYGEALQMARRVEDTYNEARFLLGTAEVLHHESRDEEAKPLAKKAEEFIRELGYGDLRTHFADILELLI